MEFTVNEIFMKLSALAIKSNVDLKYSNKMFFVDLLRLLDSSGIYDSDRDMRYVELPVSYFCKNFKLSNHVVQSSISLLEECGLLIKVNYDKCFRKLSNDRYILNKPNRIYVNEKLLKEIDYEEYF